MTLSHYSGSCQQHDRSYRIMWTRCYPVRASKWLTSATACTSSSSATMAVAGVSAASASPIAAYEGGISCKKAHKMAVKVQGKAGGKDDRRLTSSQLYSRAAASRSATACCSPGVNTPSQPGAVGG
jgi:hypothetical protein